MAENYPMECAHLPEVRIITQSTHVDINYLRGALEI
jgi:hypothetical protein